MNESKDSDAPIGGLHSENQSWREMKNRKIDVHLDLTRIIDNIMAECSDWGTLVKRTQSPFCQAFGLHAREGQPGRYSRYDFGG